MRTKKTAKITRRSGAEAGAKAAHFGSLMGASPATQAKMANMAVDQCAGRFNRTGEISTGAVQERLTTRQKQTRSAFYVLRSVALSAQDVRTASQRGEAPTPPEGYTPTAEALRQAISGIPERLLRGVLVSMTEEVLNYRVAAARAGKHNEQLYRDAAAEESRRDELRRKFTTLCEAVAFTSKIANEL